MWQRSTAPICVRVETILNEEAWRLFCDTSLPQKPAETKQRGRRPSPTPTYPTPSPDPPHPPYPTRLDPIAPHRTVDTLADGLTSSLCFSKETSRCGRRRKSADAPPRNHRAFLASTMTSAGCCGFRKETNATKRGTRSPGETAREREPVSFCRLSRR